MVDHSEGIRDILVAYSGYAGGHSPIGSINQVDAANKFFVHQGEELLSETHWTSEQYKITLQASSEANLHTLKNALLNCATDRPSGFIPSTTYSSKLYQYESADVFEVVTQAGTDNFPIAAGETTGEYAWSGTAKTTLNVAESDNENQCIILNFLNHLQSLTNYSSVNLGVYGSSTNGTVDHTIHLINEADGKYESIESTAPGEQEKITVGTAKTAITEFTAAQYNEYAVTDLLTENGTTDTYVKFLIGAATDQGAMDIVITRYDSDSDIPSTQYPYLEFVYDFTATGFPYWIGFTPSHKPKQLGPNTWEMELNLTASYEVS